MNALLDFIPLIAFFFASRHYGILQGAGALLVATVVVALIHLVKQKGKLNKQQLVTLILTVVFCGLSLGLHDVIYLKWKSTIINAIFAVALVVSVIIGKPLLEMAMKTVFSLTKAGWGKLTLAWAGYFIIMAGLQYYFAFFTDEATWINFKTWGWLPVMLVFMVGQFVFLKNHLNPDMHNQLNKK